MKKVFLKKCQSLLRIAGSALILVTMLQSSAFAQQKQGHNNPDVRAGEKALLDGDFKKAIQHLSKAVESESSDPDVVYLLGYSQYQTQDYKNAITSFEKAIALDKSNTNAYYYKGMIHNNMANIDADKLSATERESLLNKAIEDYSSALKVSNNDIKLYQNRGLAYRDLGILKGTKGLDQYNKAAAEKAYDKAIADFEKVLSIDASRKDIQTELKKATVYKSSLN